MTTSGASVSTFCIPHAFNTTCREDISQLRVYAIVPTYKPGAMTAQLVRDLITWNANLHVYVIDDSTPHDYEPLEEVLDTIRSFASDRITILRTPTNKLKAGALNFGIAHLSQTATKPDILITLDDDVVIDAHTIGRMTNQLWADTRIGAVCSQSRALNKDENIITRLQGLEYLGFNATRLADEGFFYGPLVMHGMLTAYRFDALVAVGGFAESHLIEDYEMTKRLKEHGWHVRLAPNAYAWTEVPNTIGGLWKQRTRWVYGGITILDRTTFWPAIIQDLIGHGMFIATLLLIVMYFFVFATNQFVPSFISQTIIIISLSHVVLWYLFQAWFMRFYDERDWKDWLIRLSLIPEFLYAQLMTTVLVGAYLFHLLNSTYRLLPFKEDVVRRTIRRGFNSIGYTSNWGTR